MTLRPTDHQSKILKMVYFQICTCLEDYLLSDKSIPGGVEGGLIAVELPIGEKGQAKVEIIIPNPVVF